MAARITQDSHDVLATYILTSALHNPTEDNLLSLYNNNEIVNDARTHAISAMKDIISDIQYLRMSRRSDDPELNLQDVINMPHSVTGLSMLDYCMLLGFKTLALRLVENGARSPYMQAFYDRLSSVFPMPDRPQIVAKICDIINGILLFNQQYEKLMYVSKIVAPGILGAFYYLFSKSTPTKGWFIVGGTGAALLVTLLYPLIGGLGEGILFTTVASSIAIYGVYSENRPGRGNNPISALYSNNVNPNPDYFSDFIDTCFLMLTTFQRYYYGPSIITNDVQQFGNGRQMGLVNMQIVSPTNSNSMFNGFAGSMFAPHLTNRQTIFPMPPQRLRASSLGLSIFRQRS